MKRKILLGLLSSPITLIPVIGGATLLAGIWALGIKAGILAFGAATAVIAGLGVFFTRLFTGSEAITRSAVNELQREVELTRKRQLDHLDMRLQADGDPRTERLLRDLRTLADTFKARAASGSSLNATSTFDILSNVNDLFTGCVRSLEKSLELWHTAGRMKSAEAIQPLMSQRELIIQEVHKSISQLGEILATVQTLGQGQHSTGELARLRDELDQSLSIAKRVDERLNDWSRQQGELE